MLTIAPHVKTVRLVLQLRSDEYPSYRATLQTANRENVWQSGPIKPKKSRGVNQIAVLIPVHLIENRNYFIVVSGENNSGQVEEGGEQFYFGILKQ